MICYSSYELLLDQDARSPLDLIFDEIEEKPEASVDIYTDVCTLNELLLLLRDFVATNKSTAKNIAKKNYARGTKKKSLPGAIILVKIFWLSGKLEEHWGGL